MSSIHETAYPRIRATLTEKELHEIYTPTDEEIEFAKRHTQQAINQFCFLLLLKVTQRLGYFMSLHKTPKQIIRHIAAISKVGKITIKQLKQYDRSGGRQRHIKHIRTWLTIHPFDQKAEKLSEAIAERAADTKQILADIINEMLEELVKQRIELPAYSKLLRMAQAARNRVNTLCYQSLYRELSHSAKKMIEDLLSLDEKTRTTGWNELKREPKKAKSRAMKAYLQHLQWIQSLVEQVPSLGNISTSRRRQYLLEARALHVNKMRDLKPTKRYALAIIYIHSQQQLSNESPQSARELYPQYWKNHPADGVW